MTVGQFIRLWEPDSALRAFHAEAVGATGGKKIGWVVNKEGAAHLGAPFELIIEYFLGIMCPLLAVLEIWRYAMLFLTVNVSFLYLMTFCSCYALMRVGGLIFAFSHVNFFIFHSVMQSRPLIPSSVLWNSSFTHLTHTVVKDHQLSVISVSSCCSTLDFLITT